MILGCAHANQYKRVMKAIRILRTLVDRVCLHIQVRFTYFPRSIRYLPEICCTDTYFPRSEAQRQEPTLDRSCPEVECIFKSKLHKLYEFRVKASSYTSFKEGTIVVAPHAREALGWLPLLKPWSRSLSSPTASPRPPSSAKSIMVLKFLVSASCAPA